MFIANERHGFATNSSSTHFIVFFPEGVPVGDKAPYDNEYGWDRFVLASEQAKRGYFQATVKYDQRGAYIDHQSRFEWPFAQGTEAIDAEFVEDFKKMLLDPRVVVFGGNDNGGDPNIPSGGLTTEYIYGDREAEANAEGDTFYLDPDLKTGSLKNMWGKWFSRKDGDWWAVFNYDTGVRMTITFNLDLALKLRQSADQATA